MNKQEKQIVDYFANLDWQEQDELIRKVNKVLVNKLFVMRILI